MKKTLSTILAVLLLLSVACTSLAEATFGHEASGITITIPEGFLAEDMSDEDFVSLLIIDENDENIAYVYAVSYMEALEGMWLTDLDEAAMQAFAEGVAEGVGDLGYDFVEVDGVTYMLLANADGTYAAVATVLNGWLCMLNAIVADGYAMTEVAWEVLDTLTAGISYAE